MLGRVAVAVLLALAAERVHACSMRVWERGTFVENTPVVSANGRFTAVVRWYESLPDFTRERAEKLFDFEKAERAEEEDVDDEVRAPRETIVAALYEGRRLLAELPLDARTTGSVLVSDSGRFLVAVDRGGPCGGHVQAGHTVVTIYGADGTRLTEVAYADLLSPSDAAQVSRGAGDIKEFALRQERDGREVVVVTFEGPQKQEVERRIDVATGALLDERRDIYPAPRVFVTPVRATDSPRPYQPISAECTVGFADAVHLGSERFFSHAVDTPLPVFPSLALKVRIRGPIRLELLVSETGDVVCMRRSTLPFGIDGVTDQAVPRWKFAPYVVDGRAVKFAGELVLHFEDVLD
jgi:hypothetical protein